MRGINGSSTVHVHGAHNHLTLSYMTFIKDQRLRELSSLRALVEPILLTDLACSQIADLAFPKCYGPHCLKPIYFRHVRHRDRQHCLEIALHRSYLLRLRSRLQPSAASFPNVTPICKRLQTKGGGHSRRRYRISTFGDHCSVAICISRLRVLDSSVNA